MKQPDWSRCWYPRCEEPATADCLLCEEPTCATHAPKHFRTRPREEAAAA